MNGRTLAFFLLALSPVAELRGAPVDSRIAAVSVYADRAVVTRTAKVNLTVGEQSVVFENLPNALVEQSLQASGRGIGGASILDVTSQNVFTEAAPNEKVKALEDQIKALVRQRRVIDDRAKILEEQRTFVQRILQTSSATPAAGARGAVAAESIRPSLEDWQRLYSYGEETFGKIATELQGFDIQKEDLQIKRTALERQLNELRGARGRQSKTVTVRVSTTAPGPLEMSLRYSVPNAGWSPSYDARLRSTDRAVELSYFGIVRNGTGEDWKDVTMTLSTARPSLGGGAPTLPPWIADAARGPLPALQRQDERLRRDLQTLQGFGGNANPGGRGGTAMIDDLRKSENKDLEDAGILAAAVEAGISSATFKIPVTVSIPGNSVSQKVAINTAKFVATLQFQATPKILEAAFLSAYTSNTTDYPLLAGPMNTFLDDAFVAMSSLKNVMPGEKFELQLGADDGIAVKRRLVNRLAEDAGSKTKRVSYQFLITITNNKSTMEHIVFKEPTPVSRDEKIVVKVQTPSEKEIGTPASVPLKEVTKEEDGKLVWRIDLKPGEKREYNLKLYIEHPADMAVTGVE